MDASSNFQHVYQCHAFHDSFTGGKASGELTLSAHGFNYRVGHLSGDLPFSQLHLSLGGASDRLLFIKHPSLPDLTLYTSDLSILKNPILKAHPECAPQLLKAHQKRQQNWGVLIGITAFIVALPI